MKITQVRSSSGHRIIIILCALTLLLLTHTPLQAMDNNQTRRTLSGISGVHVVVEDLRLEIEEAGLTRDNIHKLAQDKLRIAEISVLNEGQWAETAGNPWLYVYAHVMKRRMVEEDVYIFNISLELKQKVLLVRTQERTPVFATTWSKSILGKSGSLDDARMGIELCLEDFIEAFKSANGR